MNINTKTITTMTEANQNFSQVAKKVDRSGTVVILKNNKPQYLVSKFNEDNFSTEMQMLTVIAKMILTEHAKAFKELAQ